MSESTVLDSTPNANATVIGATDADLPTDTDVVVIGLGPTGLTMAHALAARGVDVVALEREPHYYGMARAVFTDDECLRIMQNLGLADELHADMLHDLRVRWVSADGEELGWFHDPSTRHGWPTANFFYQPLYEQTLERGLEQYATAGVGHGSVTIRRGRAVVSAEPDANGAGVLVTHEGSTGAGYGRGEHGVVGDSRETLRARYVVACDGGRSVIRRQLGIEMVGKRFPQRWLVVDLAAPEGDDGPNPFAHLQTFDFVCDAVLPTVSCPQPHHRHRFEFMLHDDDATADFERPEKAAELIEKYCAPGTYVITRQLVYTFNALVADRWRDGRIFLAGDAAHMTPQFIGQGMNAGLRDADNLAWKLADVIHGRADEALLDTYESERRPHATAMIALSVLNKDMVSTSNAAIMKARDVVVPASVRVPGVKRFITEAKIKPRPRLRRGAYFGMPRGLTGAAGTLMPQPRVTSLDGAATRFDDAVGNGWLAIGLGVDPRQVASTLAETGLAFTLVRLDAVTTAGGAAREGIAQSASTRTVSDPPDASKGAAPVGTAAACPVGPIDTDDAGGTNLVHLTTDDPTWRGWCRRARYGRRSVIVVRPDKVVFGVARPGAAHRASDLRELTALVHDPSSALRRKGR